MNKCFAGQPSVNARDVAASWRPSYGEWLGTRAAEGFDRTITGRYLEEKGIALAEMRAGDYDPALSLRNNETMSPMERAFVLKGWMPPAPDHAHAMTEADWKASPWYRKEISFRPDMTATRARIMAENFDERRRRAAPERIGTVRDGSEYRAGYVEGLGKLFRDIKDRSYPIVIDAANGAASSYVGPLFSEWSGGVTFMANDPDGTNINKNVGVTHIETLAAKVRETGAALGIAYDGDTDRVLMCDGKGRVLDGDIMLWVIGRWLASRGELGAGVVATVMSNMVLEDLLAQEGIKVFRCPVGDRYVLDTMKREGARIGGEQSGHIIALDYANTGDGLCSGILFLKAVGELGEDVSTLVDRFDRYPQVLRNMKVKDKNAVMSSPLVEAAAKEAERLLAGKGRMLLRPSGTEPLIRIFAESRDAELMNRAADIMEEAIGKVVNAQ